MDWYLSGDDTSSVSALRRQVRDYLARHADPGSHIGDAELVVQELVSNAVNHATGPVWVSLSWRQPQPDLVVWDLGPGFALPTGTTPSPPVPVQALDASTGASAPYPQQGLPDLLAEGGRGLFLVTHLAGALDVAARRSCGSRVETRLPVTRAPSRSIDPPRPAAQALPALDEAQPGGGFGRESFLRALVVQLAHAVEHDGGPDLAEGVVAQVGSAVGGQLEAEFRAARGIVDRLTPEQLAECFVRLKHAIDGRFYVVEVTSDRIVLGNERCPFGNSVRTSPALCRMTSSVFGGIAAHNSAAGAAVLLEERIAVGDPGCRVVVYLGPVPEGARRFAHRYRSPAGSAPGDPPRGRNRVPDSGGQPPVPQR